MLTRFNYRCIQSSSTALVNRFATSNTGTLRGGLGRVFLSSSSSSSSSSHDYQTNFRPQPPKELNLDMARGIQNANRLILRHGVGHQRLQLLSQQSDLPLVLKWQHMMEIYLGAQLHILAALGFDANEQGIMTYTQKLSHFVGGCDPDTQEEFRTLGRETWRTILATAFQLNETTVLPGGQEMSIVDARNTVHKVATKLMEPSILEMVAQRCAKIPPQSDPQMEMGMKHQIIQDIVVNQVYLGGSPSLVEELGFGSGETGYAIMQYVMSYHENDPLCTQYTSSAMMRLWQAAGLDLSQHAGAAALPLGSPGP